MIGGIRMRVVRNPFRIPQTGPRRRCRPANASGTGTMRNLASDGRDDPRKGDGGADREIDPSRNDDQRLSECADADDRDLAQNDDEVVEGEESPGQEGEEHDQRCKKRVNSCALHGEKSFSGPPSRRGHCRHENLSVMSAFSLFSLARALTRV